MKKALVVAAVALAAVVGVYLADVAGVDTDGGISPCLREEPDNPCKE